MELKSEANTAATATTDFIFAVVPFCKACLVTLMIELSFVNWHSRCQHHYNLAATFPFHPQNFQGEPTAKIFYVGAQIKG